MKRRLMQLTGATSILLLIISMVLGSCGTTSQTAEKNTARFNMTSTDWVFTANSANPQSGRTRQLTSGYNVTLTGSKLVSYLPYFGQASAGADLFSGHGPLDFTSLDLTTASQSRKGALNVTLKPKDQSEVQSMEFTFYDNGTAYLSVLMLHRSSISFTGTVEQIKS